MISKRPGEEFYRYHEFRRSDGQGWLNSGETVASTTVTAAEKISGTDVSSSMISNVAAYGSPATMVIYKLKGGSTGKLYIIAIKITTSTGQKFEDTLEVKVI